MKKLLLLFALLLVINSLLFAQFNNWVDADNMLSVRLDHTSTLLPNGKVLIVGWDSNVAELYDPVSDAFIKTGSTHHNHRQGLTATLLNNGKVLIVGGLNALKIAELYDPQIGSFQLIDTLNAVHEYHTATLLDDGRVLIAAGQNQVGPQTHAVCEIYDPVTGKFSVTDSLNVHRSSHSAVRLSDGRVLIIGGIQTTTPGNGIYLNSCEIFDPISGEFTLTQNLDQARQSLDATLLKNGKVLVTCGAWYQRYGEIFDPVTETWSLTTEMTVMRRNSHTATMLHNGKVLLVGGFIDSATPTAEIYDPATNVFTAIDSMKVPRMNHVALRLQDGSVLVTGGYSIPDVVNSAERYIVDTSGVVSVKEINGNNPNIPQQYRLFQNYPNPFNPSTTISWQSPTDDWQTLKVYDVLGNEIITLVNEYKPAGSYEAIFEAATLPSGLYFYRLQAGLFTETKKMILLR